MSMTALSPLLKLQVLISLVLSLGLILNSLLISSNLLLHILICLRRSGSSIMNILKRSAKKMKLLMMIATCMIQFLKMKFYISMLIFVEWIDLVKRPMIEEEKYCKQHKHERTITWVRYLNEIARELCDLYPFNCELCGIEGHFNFQCMYFQNITVNQLCDNMTTSDLYDELMLFWMCEELS